MSTSLASPRIGLPHVPVGSLLHLDDQLAEILPLQQADEALGRALQTLDDIFAVFDAALADPLPHLLVEGGPLIGEFPLDEAADIEASAQHLAHDHRQAVGSGIRR